MATTLVNILTVDPALQPRLLSMLRENTDTVISTLDGWISTELIASADGERVVIVSQWRDDEAVSAMRAEPRMAAYFPRLAALAKFDSVVGRQFHARRSAS